MEKVKAKALSDTYYRLLYKEKGQIKFLDWPFPQIPLGQFDALKEKAREADRQAKGENRPVQGDPAMFHQQLPPTFLVTLPVYSAPMTRDQDPNRDVYLRDGQKLYRVIKNPAYGGDVGTMYALTVREAVSAEEALARVQEPRDGEPASSNLALNSSSFSVSYLWPSGRGVELRQVPAKGQAITEEEYSRHKRLYGDLLFTENGVPGLGVTMIEGGFVYYDVRLTRVERGAP
jgi:hypothetical protein